MLVRGITPHGLYTTHGVCHAVDMTTRTYWHIAHPSYDGGDLLCRAQLALEDRAPEWTWDEAPEGFDADVVCLFPDTAAGRQEADWLWYDRPDYHLVRVVIPEDQTDVLMTTVDEGYPAAHEHIPAAWCTTVATTYTEGALQ